MEVYDTAVVGGGVAGYTAALTADHLGLRVLWLGEELLGGKILAAEKVRNFPAFSGTGAQFSEALLRQREEENIPFTRARIDGIYRLEGNFLLTAGKENFSARTVILCTGVELRGAVLGEREFFGRGVSYCAVCDGALYRGRDIAAVLYDKRFLPEAEYLAGFARTVHAFCLFDGAASPKENIVFHRGAPRAVIGGDRVSAVESDEGNIPVDGVFFLKNATPPAALAFGLETKGAHVAVTRDLATNIEGLFAAGDVTGTPYQFAKAAGEGLVAAFSAKEYLKR